MSDIYDLAILGGGPAGITAAIYASRARLNTIWIDKNFAPGGQITATYEVDNYPGMPGISGMDLGEAFGEHARKLGLEPKREKILSLENISGDIKTIHTKKNEYQARTIILAFGAEHRKLDIPGEDDLGGLGVSYCATCDGAFYKDRTAVVVGGGNAAAEDAVFLSGLCKKVYLVHRRDELRADKAIQEKVFDCENIEMVWESIPLEILGQDEVTGIKIQNVKTGEERELDTDGVFIAVGIVPNTTLLEAQLELDENGYICAGEEGITSAAGVFAAGDIRTKALRQVVTAVSDGANAVASAQKYLWRKDNGNH
ncbi:thioredoxin-disulfide reductase [Blautia schinkii]|uniref:thioredoxin-disulfide reductase n=1 Tax=Blautia schinkii TaxID=180164 RepID=UPI00156F339D|nr:thioredoxin-disulfide reductase [Blautia schinkii]NSG82258.1 thioredoxin-disulfide reductase [Blautia schinkii]NSK22861.1 thioredoxin-disulfide reductase [Blautia schinkii]NSK25901.1 thioredoxin-disulfide reductase [Blautia schinkii]NSK31911.1 thioredoxin-disulfide reductase [Blautia schinkii]NSK50035.1 thioredoxin-disulfide reductase [Blautia schinkii]